MSHYKKGFKSLFGEKLRETRSRMCLTQEEMAELIHISPRSYSDLERGMQGPSARSLMEILRVLPEEERRQLMDEFWALAEEE